MIFPFNQPEKTKDCGYRCVYYILHKKNKINETYTKWLEQFQMFDPVRHGILFCDICQILNFYQIEYKFTNYSEEGLYLILSGKFLPHSHYFLYENKMIYCTTKSEPYELNYLELLEKLETKVSDQAHKCVKIL